MSLREDFNKLFITGTNIEYDGLLTDEHLFVHATTYIELLNKFRQLHGTFTILIKEEAGPEEIQIAGAIMRDVLGNVDNLMAEHWQEFANAISEISHGEPWKFSDEEDNN